MKPVYSTNSTREVSNFLDSIAPQFAAGERGQAILDGVKDQIKNQPGTAALPARLQALLGRMSEKDEGRVLDSVAAGIAHFKAEHGAMPTADVIEAAVQQGESAFIGVDPRGNLLDAATSAHHDQMSLQPNRAVVATLSAIAEAIPFAAYLPVDIGSNQAKLAILSHIAGNTYGDYTANGLMDGTAAGDVYTSSSRFVRFDISGSQPFNRKFTKTNLANDLSFCDPNGVALPVLRGRTIVYVNGIPVGQDAATGSAANSPISCTANIAGTDHTIAGYVTVANGDVQLTTISPPLPAGTEVLGQAFIDYETSPSLIPNVLVKAEVWDLYANPWRVKTGISIDAAGQVKNELGLDADSEALMAIRTQMSMERHYQALRMARALGYNNQDTYDFDYDGQIAQKNRAGIWQDFMPVLSNLDQAMANKTMDHGITHIYAPSWVVSQWEGLPGDMFTPSGIAKRPGIYRAGRLFGKYEVYYSPKGPTQTTDLTSAELVCIGRSSQVARCPIVLGDAIAPTFIPLGTQSDLVNGSAMFARDFTVVNPHQPSAMGCARLTINNMK